MAGDILIATSGVLFHLCNLNSDFGVPEIIVSDNGPQFTYEKFHSFCVQYDIQHIRTPAYHAQSNGEVERFVDTFKRALIKIEGEGNSQEIIDTFLQQYRTTPNPSLPEHQSPSETFLERSMRTVFDNNW